MADNKAGGISYDVDANVEGLLKAESQVEKSADKMAGSFDKTTAAEKRMATQQKATVTAIKNTNRSIGRQNQMITQMGFQLQDVSVQLQGGQSPFVVLGQQGSQVASLFGPGGAVFGAVLAIAAAIGGTLFSSLIDAGDATKDFIQDLSDMEGGFDQLGEKQKALAVLLAENKITELEKQIESLSEKEREAIKVTDRQTEAASRRAAMQQELIRINQALEFNERQSIKSLKLSATQVEELEDKQFALSAALGALEKITKTQTLETATYSGEVEKLNEELKKQKERLDLIKSGLDPKAQENAIKVIDRLEESVRKLGKSELELLEIQRQKLLSMDGLSQSDKDRINNAINATIAFNKESESISKVEAAERKLAELRNQIGLLEGTTTQADIDVQRTGLDPESEHAAEIQRAHERIATIKAQQQAQREADQEREQMINRYASTASSAFQQTLAQTHDIEDATKAAARAVAQDMVGALIKYAAQWAVTQALQLAGITTTTSAQVASGASITAAMTPAAAAASVATAGAAPTAGLSSLAAAVPAMMALFTRGGRATGGTVQAGQPYRVTEHGTPETFRSPMGNIFIPPTNGRIDRGGSMGDDMNIMLSVSVTQSAGAAPAQVQQTDSGVMIRGAVDAVAAQISAGRGNVVLALQRNTDTRFKTRR